MAFSSRSVMKDSLGEIRTAHTNMFNLCRRNNNSIVWDFDTISSIVFLVLFVGIVGGSSDTIESSTKSYVDPADVV